MRRRRVLKNFFREEKTARHHQLLTVGVSSLERITLLNGER